MLEGLGSENAHSCCCSEAVVSAESGAFGAHPTVVDVSLDRVFLEIMDGVGVLLWHHVEVSLQDDALAVLVTWRCWLADDDVAGFVDDGLKTEVLTEFLHESDNLCFLLRWTRDACQAVEVFKYFFWL